MAQGGFAGKSGAVFRLPQAGGGYDRRTLFGLPCPAALRLGICGCDRVWAWLCDGDVPGKVAGQTVKKGVLYLKLRAHILAGAGLSSGIFRVAWMVPRGVFVACGGTQGKRDHRAEALPSDFAGLYLKSDVFCRHCPPHPAKAG